jgi:hypothetical protein
MVAGLVMEFSAYHASKPQIPTEPGIFRLSGNRRDKNFSVTVTRISRTNLDFILFTIQKTKSDADERGKRGEKQERKTP